MLLFFPGGFFLGFFGFFFSPACLDIFKVEAWVLKILQ